NKGGTVTSDTLCVPLGVVTSGNAIYIADSGNNRVLEYDDPRGTDTSADAVLGQSDFTSNSLGCHGSGESAATFCSPTRVAADSVGNLYVTDQSNDRVLLFLTPLTSDHVAD